MARILVRFNQALDSVMAWSNTLAQHMSWSEADKGFWYKEYAEGVPEGIPHLLPSTVGEGLGRRITQTGHGFSAFTPVRWDDVGGEWVKGLSDAEAHYATAMVTSVVDTDTFEIATFGSWATALDAGRWYLSATVAGELTQTVTDQPVGWSDGTRFWVTFSSPAKNLSGTAGTITKWDPTGKFPVDSPITVGANTITVPTGYTVIVTDSIRSNALTLTGTISGTAGTFSGNFSSASFTEGGTLLATKYAASGHTHTSFGALTLGGAVTMGSDASYDIGSAVARVRKLYASDAALDALTINGTLYTRNLLSDIAGTRDIGSTDNRYAKGWFNNLDVAVNVSAFTVNAFQLQQGGTAISSIYAAIGHNHNSAYQPLKAVLAGLDELPFQEFSGMVAYSHPNMFYARTILKSGNGITITDGDGSAGNPTITLDADLQAISVLTGTGWLQRTGDGTWALGTPAGGVTGSGTAGKIPKWSTTSVLTDSLLNEIGTNIVPTQSGVGLGTATAPFGTVYYGSVNSIGDTSHLVISSWNYGVKSYYYFKIDGDGKHSWGNGDTIHDTLLYRNAIGELKTDGAFTVVGNGTFGGVFASATTADIGSATTPFRYLWLNSGLISKGDASPNILASWNQGVKAYYYFTLTNGGILSWGTGDAAQDTNLYRSAADTLKTDDSFVIGAGLTVNGNTTLGDSSSDTLTVNATPTFNTSTTFQNASIGNWSVGTAGAYARIGHKDYNTAQDACLLQSTSDGSVYLRSGSQIALQKMTSTTVNRALFLDATATNIADSTVYLGLQTNRSVETDTAICRLSFMADDDSTSRTLGEYAYINVQSTGTWDGSKSPLKMVFGLTRGTATDAPMITLDSGAGYSTSTLTTTVHSNLIINESLSANSNTTLGSSSVNTLTVNATLNAVLNSSSYFTSTRSATTSTAFQAFVSGDSQPRFNVRADGQLQWGAGGSSSVDTILYRSAADTLRTDDNFIVDLDLTINGNASFGATSANTLTVNSTTTFGAAPTINVSDSVTNVNVTALKIKHTSSGTIASGFGASIDFQVRDTDNVDNTIARIQATRSLSDNTGLLGIYVTSYGTDTLAASFTRDKDLNVYRDLNVTRQISTPSISTTSATITSYANVAKLQSYNDRQFLTRIESDFYTAGTNAVPGILGAALSSGTVATVDGEIHHPGVISISDSTTANGGYRFMTEVNAFLLQGLERFEFVFQARNARTTASFRMGFQDSTAINTLPTDGVYFSVVGTGTAATITGICKNNSSAGSNTSSTSAYTLTLNAWYTCTVELDSLASSAIFTVYDSNGTSVLSETISTNIPTGTGRQTGFGIIAGETSTDAAAVICYLDFMQMGNFQRYLTR